MSEQRQDHERNKQPTETTPAVSDAELLARHVNGDCDAFGELVRRHGRYLFSVACGIVARADAEDVVQAAFLNAVRSADRFERRSSVRTWLHRIVVNEALNHIRRIRRAFEDPLDDHDQPRETAVDVDSHVVGQDHVTELLDALPLSTRQMVVLVDLLGYSTAEAARALGVAEGTVKSRRSRALARLAHRVQR